MAPDRPDPSTAPDDWAGRYAEAALPAPSPLSAEEEAAADARADADVAAGRLVPHDKLVGWLKTWGTPDYRPYPREWFR